MKRNEETQEILFDLNDDQECSEALKSLYEETEIGQRYISEFYDGDEDGKNQRKILRATDTLFILDNAHASVSQLAIALKTVLKSGSIRPVEEPEEDVLESPVVDSTPRGKDGKALTGSQLVWREYREWSETHSSGECKARARSGDQAYADFYRLNLAREFAAEPVGDAVTPAGQVARTTQATNQLVQFVKDYHKEPVTNLRPLGGFVKLAGEQLPWNMYQEMLNKAAAAGLL
jgi:hypothetical protein